VLPLAGGIAQLAVPRLLDRTDGNLRGLTILIAAIGEPRGLYFAALAALFAAGLVSGPVALVALAVLVAITCWQSPWQSGPCSCCQWRRFSTRSCAA
jgi:hypothetical protein